VALAGAQDGLWAVRGGNRKLVKKLVEISDSKLVNAKVLILKHHLYCQSVASKLWLGSFGFTTPNSRFVHKAKVFMLLLLLLAVLPCSML
jgi:hypothetical protein